MLNTNESVLMEYSSSHQDTQTVLQPLNPFLHELPGEMLYQAFKQSHQQDDPLEELIATGNAAFTFIREKGLTMEKETQDTFTDRKSNLPSKRNNKEPLSANHKGPCFFCYTGFRNKPMVNTTTRNPMVIGLGISVCFITRQGPNQGHFF